MTVKWHCAPTLAGNPNGRRHYDIGGDDGSNVALVYPSEDGDEDTLRKARLIADAPERPHIRKAWRNIWCILRSLDRHEIECDSLDWPRFRDDPHAYFVRCDDATSDAIWAAVERRM